MNVSAIGCTSIRPNESSFKARRYQEDYEPRHKNTAGDTVKKVIVAASVFTAGTLATKSLSAKLLNKISNNSALAGKVGKAVVNVSDNLEKLIAKIPQDKKIGKLEIGKIAKTASDKVFTFVEGFAKKGLDFDAAKAAEAVGDLSKKITKEDIAINGVKRALTYAAGGSAGIAAAKDADKDGTLDIKEKAGEVILNLAGAVN